MRSASAKGDSEGMDGEDANANDEMILFRNIDKNRTRIGLRVYNDNIVGNECR